MAKLTYKARNKLPSDKFALPAERKYPIYDKAHARNALARVAQSASQKNLTPAEIATVKRKACKVVANGAAAIKDCLKRN